MPKHTFGGRPLDRYIYEFEPEVDPAGGIDPGGAVNPAAVDEPVTEPAWSGPSQEEWEQFQQTLGALSQLEQQRAQVYAPQPPGAGTQIDPFAEDFQAQLDSYIAERMAPVQQFQTEAQLAEAEERAMDILGDFATREGDFDRSLARLRADAILPEMQQRYGFGPKAAEAALEKAAADQRAYEQEINQRAIEKHTNHLATLSGAPGEAGSTYSVAAQQRTMPDYTKGGTVAGRFFGPNAER